jgi:hypothetical protein
MRFKDFYLLIGTNGNIENNGVYLFGSCNNRRSSAAEVLRATVLNRSQQDKQAILSQIDQGDRLPESIKWLSALYVM